MIGSVQDPLLLQDGEKALWCDEPLAALSGAGIKVLDNYPTNSADLNAIENAWALLRSRLADTQPAAREHRGQFIVRLRSACASVSNYQASALRYYAANLKEHADDVVLMEG